LRDINDPQIQINSHDAEHMKKEYQRGRQVILLMIPFKMEIHGQESLIAPLPVFYVKRKTIN